MGSLDIFKQALGAVNPYGYGSLQNALGNALGNGVQQSMIQGSFNQFLNPYNTIAGGIVQQSNSGYYPSHNHHEVGSLQWERFDWDERYCKLAGYDRFWYLKLLMEVKDGN